MQSQDADLPSQEADTTAVGITAFTKQDEDAARSQLAACAMLLLQARWTQHLDNQSKEHAMAESEEARHRQPTLGFRTSAVRTTSQAMKPSPLNTPPSRPPPLQRTQPPSSAAPANAADVEMEPAPKALDHETSTSLLDIFFAVSQELSVPSSLRSLLGNALRSCKRLVPVQSASIFLTGEDDGSMLRVGLVHDDLGNIIQGELAVVRIRDVRMGLVGHTLLTNRPTIVQDTAADANFDPYVDCAPGYVVRSVLGAPIAGSHGRLLGAVQLCNRLTAAGGTTRDFSNEDERAAVIFARMLAAPLERLLTVEGFFDT